MMFRFCKCSRFTWSSCHMGNVRLLLETCAEILPTSSKHVLVGMAFLGLDIGGMSHESCMSLRIGTNNIAGGSVSTCNGGNIWVTLRHSPDMYEKSMFHTCLILFHLRDICCYNSFSKHILLSDRILTIVVLNWFNETYIYIYTLIVQNKDQWWMGQLERIVDSQWHSTTGTKVPILRRCPKRYVHDFDVFLLPSYQYS